MKTANGTLLSELSKIPDPRIDRQKRHKMLDILTITICASICGANTWEQIERYGESKLKWFSTFLELPNGIPSHDTIRRVFILMNPDEFRVAFINWIESIKNLMPNEVVSIDGKTLPLQRHFIDI